jgi:hypothetical protein
MKQQEPRASHFMGLKEQPILGARGTWLEPESLTYPSGAMLRRCRALCEDGKLRIIRCGLSDTFFSINAGKKGYITSKEDEETGLPIFQFITYEKPNFSN